MDNYKSLNVLLTGGVMILLLLTCISCAGSNSSAQNIKESKSAASEKKVSEADYSGTYRSSDTKVCDIMITVKKDKSGFIYTINGAGVKSSGKLTIVKDDEQTYLVFSGTLRSGDKTAIEGLYSEDKILIQNYGNSMNQYVCFKRCDTKYLEFVRSR